ncbi:PaaI family thioesterase [Variovorax rhizosphaerae]|uniref:Acyl-coenzyme A thioesterase THEM4 n=1 Tax=Variovorax rhizosphaerae TaxID=1836200 RepID=A0ABU8WY26_9BURK
MALLGPMHAREEADGQLRLGLHLRAAHMNHQEAAHGGFVATLADNALGVNVARHLGKRVATANLSVDYLARVSVGDWLEVVSRIDKVGGRLVFAECSGQVADRAVFKARGIFAVLPELPDARKGDSEC